MVKSDSWISIRICALHEVLDISSFKRLCGFVSTSASISFNTSNSNKNYWVHYLYLPDGEIQQAAKPISNLTPAEKDRSDSSVSLFSIHLLRATRFWTTHTLHQFWHSAGPLLRKLNDFSWASELNWLSEASDESSRKKKAVKNCGQVQRRQENREGEQNLSSSTEINY